MITKNSRSKIAKKGWLVLLLFLGIWMFPQNASEHCDSDDGPVVKDALKALETNNLQPVLKWVEATHEKEITDLFHKTLKYKSGDKEVYSLLEKHFLETLVRLHREGE